MQRRVALSALSTLVLIAASAGSVRAESAIRGAFAEVRPNGSAQAASFEHVLPDNFYFGSTLDEGSTTNAVGFDTLEDGTAFNSGTTTLGAGRIGSALFVENTAPGTNESSIRSLLIQAGPARSTSQDIEGVDLSTPSSLEDAIAERVAANAAATEEDVTGFIRAFVGADGFSADASLD